MSSGKTVTARGQRILVVEDMAVVGADIQNTLANAGYQVVGVVGSGEEAMEAASQLRPELVLMDVKLEGQVDGVEAAHWIRQELGIPAIYLTAYSDEEMLQRAMVTEPFAYIVKPINRRELIANVQVALYRSEVEKALHQSEARYAAVVQQSTECILLADVDGCRILEANPAAQRLLGYRPDEVEGLTLDDIVAGDRGKAHLWLCGLATTRAVSLGAQQYRARNGTLIDVEASACLVVYNSSEVVCVVARDISQRRRAEAALAAAQRELDAQRALSLRVNRHRSLGEIAGGIVNEFVQPLDSLRALLRNLQSAVDGAEPRVGQVRGGLGQILGQVDRMVQMAEHVRCCAREAGRQERLPVQVNEVVTAAVDLAVPQFRALDVQLICAPVEGLPPVLANPFSLEEVVLSLLTSARAAVQECSEAGRRWVRVRTGLDPGHADEVVITVEDSGPGIPPAAAERVFEPLFTHRGAEPPDLGRCIARAIVEQLDGHLEVLSRLGEGTEVRIRLPAGR